MIQESAIPLYYAILNLIPYYIVLASVDFFCALVAAITATSITLRPLYDPQAPHNV
jgi:hypothetical protein